MVTLGNHVDIVQKRSCRGSYTSPGNSFTFSTLLHPCVHIIWYEPHRM